MRRFVAYLVLTTGILVPSLANANAFTFSLENTTTTDAYDLTVAFNKAPVGGITGRSAHIFDNAKPMRGDTGNAFPQPGLVLGSTVKYKDPQNNQAVKQGYSVKFTIETDRVPGMRVDNNTNTTFFTDVNGMRIPNSAKLVAANLDLNRDPNTGIVSVSIGNPTSDFLFVTDIEIWTGLTESQANNFDANGDFVINDLPSSPNFTPADITLLPNQLFGPPILIRDQAIGSYVVALYDLADGPDSNIGDAIQYGQFVFSDLVVPEPSSLIILVGGLIVLGAWNGLRNLQSNPAG